MAITEAEVKKAIELRKVGKPWSEVCEVMGKPLRWQIEVRPFMKKVDAKSVKPSYERHTAKKASTTKPKATGTAPRAARTRKPATPRKRARKA